MGVAFAMNRGFVFTIDSILAITAVTTILTVWVLMPAFESTTALRNLELKAQDEVTVGLYTGNTFPGSVPTQSEWDDLNYGVCKKYFYVQDFVSGAVEHNTYCEKVS